MDGSSRVLSCVSELGGRYKLGVHIRRGGGVTFGRGGGGSS